jgi:hypothetical protein
MTDVSENRYLEQQKKKWRKAEGKPEEQACN